MVCFLRELNKNLHKYYDKFRGTIVAEILTNHLDEIERVLLRRIGFGEKSQGFVEKRSNLF